MEAPGELVHAAVDDGELGVAEDALVDDRLDQPQVEVRLHVEEDAQEVHRAAGHVAVVHQPLPQRVSEEEERLCKVSGA